MLTANEIVSKIHEQPERFKQLMQEEKYCAAKWCFYSTLVTALFIEMDKPFMERMFGENGLFEEELVRKAFREAGGDIADRTGDCKEAEDAGGHFRPPLPEEGLLICTRYGMPDFLVSSIPGA